MFIISCTAFSQVSLKIFVFVEDCEIDGEEKVIAYFSKVLSKPERIRFYNSVSYWKCVVCNYHKWKFYNTTR
ncbi:hypothetical protein QE152_g38822 [Popillia japonica]|uniref:Uncharacterized protein n=1 Tax=Popillia japonica TaxID=7064 RepID=A0AAW1HW69_POPJA